MDKVFGIDLGTTYSVISHVDEHGKAVVIPNSDNHRVTPSVVFFDGDNIIVGEVAKESARLYPDAVVSCVKNDMGNPNFQFAYNGKIYLPEEISSLILRKLVQDAEQNLGVKIKYVVITCPAYFGINEREATKKAAELAGLTPLHIINEPTAAAIAYNANDEKNILVFDLGGGTFDITIIRSSQKEIKVIVSDGDHNLGGKDWDCAIMEHCVQTFQQETGIQEDILEDLDTLQELQLAAEKAKQTLSRREKAPIAINHNGEKVRVELTRDKFEQLTLPLLERTISLTHNTLKQAEKKGHHSFEQIVLVGGSTRMPQVARRLQAEFDMEPQIFDPDEAVCKGAALFAHRLLLKGKLFEEIAEITKQTLTEVENTPAKEMDQNILDMAIQKLADDMGETTLAIRKTLDKKIIDVASKTFGIVANDERGKEAVFNLIFKNDKVPASVTSKDFGTQIDNQTNVQVRIMENESDEYKTAVDVSKKIRTRILELPSKLPQGSPIHITFKLTEAGLLEITAVEATQGGKIDITIETITDIS